MHHIVTMVFGKLFGRRNDAANQRPSLPTIKFDASRVTETVCVDLWSHILEFDDLPDGKAETIYEAALLSISRGRDLNIIAKRLIELGVTKQRAGQIARVLNNRASSLMEVDRALAMGLTEQKWLYSGAPCFVSKDSASGGELQRDAEHKAANGKRYPLSKGLMIGGRLTYPGREAGCKCVGVSVMPGFDD